MIVAGVSFRTRRANPGGDPSIMGAKRPPNSRDAMVHGATPLFKSFPWVPHDLTVYFLIDSSREG